MIIKEKVSSMYQPRLDNIKEFSEEFDSILNDIIDIYYAIFKNVKLNDVTSRVTAILTREALERVDGIKVLGYYGSIKNSSFLLRGLVEQAGEINFILNNHSEKRAQSYLYFKRKDYINKKRKAGLDITEEETDLKDFFKSIKPEYNKIRKKKNWIKWNDLYNLENESIREGLELGFKFLSSEVHGQNSLQHNYIKDDGRVELRSLRFVSGIEVETLLNGTLAATITLGIKIQEKLLDKEVVREEDLKKISTKIDILSRKMKKIDNLEKITVKI